MSRARKFPKWVGLALIVALILFILIPVARKLSRPDVLFSLCHGGFILFMTAWAGTMAFQAWKKETGQISERFYLVLVDLIFGSGILLTVFSFSLRGRTVLPEVPFLPWTSAMSQGLALFVLFSILIWAGHASLDRVAKNRDPFIYPVVCFLTGTGLVLLFRLAPDLWESRHSMVMGRLAWTQLRSVCVSFLILGCAVLYFSRENLERLTRRRYTFAVISIVLITLTAVFGTQINGRRLSLNLGVMNFQTVELVKIFALLFMTGYFRYEMTFIEAGKNSFNLPRGRYLIPYLIMWVMVLLPIFLQKDLGPTALIFMLFVGVFYLGTGSWLSVLLGFVIMMAAGYTAWYTGVPSMVRTRVDMWLSPFQHSQNMAEALWAVSGGGWLGTGLGRGLCHRIPVVQSDFNFAALAEAWGFLGVFSILVAFAVLVKRTLVVSRKSELPYIQLFTAGLAILWVCQVVIIVGGNAGLLPLTGITLPFISYGGSSLVVSFLAAGIILRISNDEHA